MVAGVLIQPEVSGLSSPGGVLRVARLYLGGVPRGAVILLCRAGTLDSAAERMNGLAEHGYESVAADLAGAAGGPVPDQRILSHVEALIGLLAGRGWSGEQIGVVGYGSGGRAALLAAAHHTLGAAVSVAPQDLRGAPGTTSSTLMDAALAVRTPWLGMFGGLDDGTPGAIALGEAQRAVSAVFTQVVAYPGVSGDFHADSREPAAHAAAFDSWQRIVEWLDARVVPRPTPLAAAWQARQAGG